MQYAFTDLFIKRVAQHTGYVDEIILEYVGDGSDKSRGLDIAAHENLGELVPPINLQESSIGEASPAGPSSPQGDSPDIASAVPAPGASTGKP